MNPNQHRTQQYFQLSSQLAQGAADRDWVTRPEPKLRGQLIDELRRHGADPRTQHTLENRRH